MRARIFKVEQELEFVKQYNLGHSCPSIASANMTNEATMHGILKRHNVVFRTNSASHRKYTINEHAFDNLSSEQVAYWYGFLYADGIPSLERHSIGITLSSVDEGHIDKFLKFVGSNAPILHPPIMYSGKPYSASSVCIRSYILSARLADIGIVPYRKESHLPMICVEPKYFRHWVRGLFDGDGSVFESNTRSPVLHTSFLSRRDILIAIRNSLTQFGCNSLPSVSPHHGEKVFSLGYTMRSDCKLIYDYLYSGASVFLDRKFEKFSNAISRASFSEIYSERKIKALKLFKEGMRVVEIADEVNMPFESIYRWIRSLGWKR